MAKKSKIDTVGGSKFIILTVCLSLVFLSVLAFLVYLIAPDKPMASKEEIYENIENFDPDKNYNYTAVYLEKLGIHGFDKKKFKECEDHFIRESIFYTDSRGTLAVKTAEYFLTYFYDEIDFDDEEALTDALLRCYVEAIGDKYAVYRTKEQYESYKENMSGSFAGIGVTVSYNREIHEIEIMSVIDGSGAFDAGILAGDKILAVDGTALADVTYEELIALIKGEVGSHVDVTVDRGGEAMTFTVTRKIVEQESVFYSLDDEKIGYIVITSFKDNTPDQFREAIDALTEGGAVGLIFDVRDNPGGYFGAVVDVIDYLVPKGTRIASYFYLGEERVFYAIDDHSVDLPMTVIFNGVTASAGELFSAALRDYTEAGILNSVSVGELTRGKGVMQSTRPLSDGSYVTFTTSYYNPPSNVNYDAVGIYPDVEAPEVQGIDNPYETAYAELKKLIENLN